MHEDLLSLLLLGNDRKGPAGSPFAHVFSTYRSGPTSVVPGRLLPGDGPRFLGGA
jgi:hypothetical protein